MTGAARRRSRGRRSIATIAHTSTVIATPTLPMMSNVVPLCGPASNSSETVPWGPKDPLSKDIDPEPEDDGPDAAALFTASAPANSMDVP